ncbi:MAG: hypothetical protein R6V46_01640 [Desulfatiglandaceae bacterium]
MKDLCDKEALSIYAGVVKDIKTLKRYEWCGHSVMMGIIKRPWQDADAILSYFGKMRKRGIEKYEQFVEQGVKAGSRPGLVGGICRGAFLTGVDVDLLAGSRPVPLAPDTTKVGVVASITTGIGDIMIAVGGLRGE